MKMKNVMIGLMLMSSMTAMAGERGGNGGDAVVCRDSNGKIIKAELLDYYEGRTMRNMKYDNSASSVKDFVTSKMSLIQKNDAKLAKELEAVVEELISASEKFSGVNEERVGDVIFTADELQDIKDSDHLKFPKGCDVEQLAIRVNRSYPEDPSFLIQADIWKKLPSLDKAGLILHEAIYKKYVEQGEEDSKNSRYFNQMISSVKMEAADFVDYVSLAASAKRGAVEVEKKSILPLTVKKYNDSGLFIAQLAPQNYDEKIIQFFGAGSDKFLVFNRSGKVDEKETRLANPRKMYFQTRALKNVLSYKISVNDKVVCESNISRAVRRNTWEEYVYDCTFELLKGSYDLKIEIESSKNATRFYWVVDDKIQTTSLNMQMWFWGATPETAKVLAGSYFDKKIKSKNPEVIHTKITVK